MIEPRLVLCSGAALADDDPRRDGHRIVELDALGHPPNVNLRLEDVARIFFQHLTPRLVDLLEIAAYVYTADANTKRRGKWEDDAVEPWGRRFRMIVPVRDFGFWTRPQVADVLGRTLQFLSDDIYEFDFEQLTVDRPKQEYLQFGDMDDWPFHGVPRVCLFSGGLDSLAGAVDMASRGEPLVLVSHRPVTTLAKRQADLVQALSRQFPKAPLLHIPVWVNKAEYLGKEFSQRTRSFLFAALGCAVAESIGAEGIRFFENGVVSLNLPVADEVLGARASRTTHPQALHLFGELFSLITERIEGNPFVVDNPFLHITKREVVERIACAGATHLIELSCSCAHTLHKSKSQWHCGTCSQCIDRRIAILAAGLGDADPERDYVVGVFTGPRTPLYQQNIAVDYARHALELHQMTAETIAVEFNAEISRAVRYDRDRRAAAAAVTAMHQRHATDVWRVLVAQAQLHAESLMTGSLPDTSMLALIAGQRHRTTVWQRYVARIGDVLAKSIPIMCHSAKPKNEPLLQELCDGALSGHELDLRREYPFLRWASVRTKPDWSAERLSLWIELKYVRTAGDRVKVTDAIAADITKYGVNGRRTLYVIYDPSRHLHDDAEVEADITRHAGMFVRIIH
jgi:7-cyano-7-deazaguanine synthase in queuosine biosynthesis